MNRRLLAGVLVLAVATSTREGSAQAPLGHYADPEAARLHAIAMANRLRTDDVVQRYTAVVRQRIGAALRTPLKDRTLYRVESSHRVVWDRDGDTWVQVLALREQTPVGLNDNVTRQGLFDQPFDPMNDRLLFGFVGPDDDLSENDGEDFWFEHPLYRDHAGSYRFASADTVTLSLPDGRSIRAVELQVTPLVGDVHRMSGSRWVEPESGALVRAVYRLSDTFDAFRDIPDLKEEEDGDLRFVPGLFKPWTAEISMIAVDYALWEFDVWLPRSLRAEGVMTAGILRAPATVDISYRIESVVTEGELQADRSHDWAVATPRTGGGALEYFAGREPHPAVPYTVERGWTESRGRRVRFLVPQDLSFLATSPELPPPVWEDAPGFASEEELEELFDGLAELPRPPSGATPFTLRWGPQRPDLIRYNRVEGISFGARGQLYLHGPGGPLSLTATARLGAADLEPNLRVELTNETLERRVTLGAFSELAALDGRARHLGIGNSLLAATLGRDDGDYYRRAGASLELTPPTAERQSFALRLFAEHHRSALPQTDLALLRLGNDGWSFRPNVVADRGWEYGARIALTPWWGSDPHLVQGGFDLTLRAAAGESRYVQAAGLARLAIPLPADFRVGLEGGVGTAWGSPSTQRLFYLGGPSTLRGFDPRRLVGTSFGRARGELARMVSFGAVSLFSDLGWAGDRDGIAFDDALFSVGTGLSILDGLIRVDAAWGLRDPSTFRLDVYVDAIL